VVLGVVAHGVARVAVLGAVASEQLA
jgi:hypothetical protein